MQCPLFKCLVLSQQRRVYFFDEDIQLLAETVYVLGAAIFLYLAVFYLAEHLADVAVNNSKCRVRQ